jgi:hypothetical protein
LQQTAAEAAVLCMQLPVLLQQLQQV